MTHCYSPVEYAAPSEVAAIQSNRLKKTVQHVWDNVPYYKEKWMAAGVVPGDIGAIEDITKLPFTLKQDLRDTYPYGLFAVPMSDVVRIHASSGTTGKQTVVGYTRRDLDVWAQIVARAITAAGGGADDFIQISYGYGLFTGGLGLHDGAALVGATVIPASSGNTKRQVDIMKDFGTTILCCTPSYAIYLGESLQEAGIDKSQLKLKAGIFGAEPWTDAMRVQIESLLGIKAYDIYGLSEIMGPGVGYDCEAQQGMHIHEDHFFAEIIDPVTGENLPDGELGELVITTLTKEALPLIRYRTRDLCTITREPCSCGRTFLRISKPCGRSDDMLIIRGVNVFPSQIEAVLLEAGHTSPHYQLIVDRVGSLDTLEVLVEIPADMPFDSVRLVEAEEKRLSAAIQSMLGVAAQVRLVSPKTITRSEGKALRLIDNRLL